MPLPIYRLRRLLAVIAVLFTAVVAGMYLYARLRQHSVLKGFPGKIAYDIKQTASGFQFSKSASGRTVFTIRAKEVKEFKLNGRADLHEVSITLYGRDTSRFDRIYGDDFTFDPKSGNVTAKGEVQIDLEANPAGVTAPDQASPTELKNPIHLKTSNLVFNRDSGDASTEDRVDFETPQATGWAVGIRYAAKSATLTLASQIHVTVNGNDAATLFASHASITRDPREVVLDHPFMKRESGTLQSEQATFYLGPQNEVQRVLATGDVNAESTEKDADPIRARADEAELLLVGKQDLLRTATLTGKVHLERIGSQPMHGDAGRVVLDFRGEEFHGQNELQKVHASEGVRLAQRSANPGISSPEASAPQDFDLTASAIDFVVAEGRRLDRAQTLGAAQITISSAQAAGQKAEAPSTVITAGRFDATFAEAEHGSSRLTSVHGAPNAKIVSVVPGKPDRVSTSRTLDAAFLPEGGIASITQQGNVVYNDGQPIEKRTQAWADKAVYTPADRILVLTGSPRVSDGGMMTTADRIRVNRSSDDAYAEGNVKSTYSDLKEQPNGALLASASPIHVTAASMTEHNSPAVAVYEGHARLWQDANIIEAPSIQFDREHRSVVAQGSSAQPVSTVMVQQKLSVQEPAPNSTPANRPPTGEHKTNKKSGNKPEESSPVSITATRMIYADSDRRAHYDGGVTARGTGFSATANEMDVYLAPRNQVVDNKSLSSPGRLDRMVAQGGVKLQETGREADCQKLVYTASEDKFVLTGGPPSIFDAERGKITGVSLTFFRGDDRVLVEGEASTPVVTQTRVAR